MTYQQLIDNIKSLGFSDDAEMQEFAESGVLYDSINRAIAEINFAVPGSAPRNKEYTFSVDKEDEEVMYIDMESIDPKFMELAETAMLYAKDDIYNKFNDFDLMNESTIVFDPTDYEGDFRVLYKVYHDDFTEDSALDEEIPLARKVHHIVPLLAGYYVWLEDEPQKAAQYYNLYEQEKTEIELKSQSNKFKCRVLPGGM